ncbi:MAG: AbrB/MazE/SpoVT family DNA-binding domain-containing protein [Anaerolineales bacterium]|nr:AbrB/MazE/SpoVT family DNA-binding domain-containing protein [Anaerolineales bacterium]
MIEPTTVKVSGRFQISLPSRARQQLNIQAGDRLLVDIQDGMLILVPQPTDYVAEMSGLHQDIWQGVNTTAYLNEERAAWKASEDD